MPTVCHFEIPPTDAYSDIDSLFDHKRFKAKPEKRFRSFFEARQWIEKEMGLGSHCTMEEMHLSSESLLYVVRKLGLKIGCGATPDLAIEEANKNLYYKHTKE